MIMLVRTVQHLHDRHFSKDATFSPLRSTSLIGSIRTCSVSKEKYSLSHHTPFGFPEALKSYIQTACHRLMPGEQRSLQKSSNIKRYMAALPGCSPDHSVISQLGKLPGSAHFPDLPGVFLRSEMAPDLLTAPHTWSHFRSCWMIQTSTQFPLILYFISH